MHEVHSIERALTHLPDAPVATSRSRSWRGATVDIHAGLGFCEFAAPALDHHLVVYTPSGTGRMLQRRGGKTYEGVHKASSVIVMPAGLDCLWRGTATPTIRLRLDVELLKQASLEIGQASAGKPELLNVFHTRDRVIAHIADLLATELEESQHPAQLLAVDAATTLLSAQLLRKYEAFGAKPDKNSVGLGTHSLRLVVSYIEDHYSSPIRLRELAQLANVSPFHFCRVFKASTGLTPMEYVEHTRLKQAESLIRSGHLSLTAIAARVGFADQSHFTRRFSRFAHCTPAVYSRRYSPRRLPS